MSHFLAHGHNPCLRKSGFCFVIDTVVDKCLTIAVNRQVNKTPASRLPENRQTCFAAKDNKRCRFTSVHNHHDLDHVHELLFIIWGFVNTISKILRKN